MAIAYDNSTDGGQAYNSTLTFAHTCSGANRILFVLASSQSGSTITGVTYNGIDMSLVTTAYDEAGYAVNYLYYLVAPATGANNVVVSGNTQYKWAIAASYTGASQTGVPDAVVKTALNASTTSFNQTLTTIADNCWVIATGQCLNAISTTAPATERQNPATSYMYLADYGPKTPAGSTTITNTCVGATAWACSIIASFKPFLDTVKTINGLAKASVKTFNGLY